MTNEVNHRYGFYLIMSIVIILLILIYIEVASLKTEVSNISLMSNSETIIENKNHLPNADAVPAEVNLEAVSL